MTVPEELETVGAGNVVPTKVAISDTLGHFAEKAPADVVDVDEPEPPAPGAEVDEELLVDGEVVEIALVPEDPQAAAMRATHASAPEMAA